MGFEEPVFTSQERAARLAGHIVTLQFSRVSVHPCKVWGGLGRCGNEFMAAAGTYSCFELLVCSPPYCIRKPNDASTSDSRGTAIVTQEQYCESSLTSMGNQQLTTYKTRSEIGLVLQYCGRAP